MSIYDVRKDCKTEISKIVFAEPELPDGTYIANYIVRNQPIFPGVCIYDGREDFVLVNDSYHARCLIDALEKAIELGWLK